MGKNIPQRKRLAALFASFSIVIMGTLSLLESMRIDYYTVLSTLEKVIPASLILGGLGWVMGMILDKPKRKRKSSYPGYNNLFFNKILKNEAPEGFNIEEDQDSADRQVEF